MRFSRLKLWQKGVFSGFLFSVFLAIVYTLVLIAVDVILQVRGLPEHQCYMITKTVPCTFTDALLSRLGFLAVFVLVIGLPLAIIGGGVGYLLDRIRLK